MVLSLDERARLRSGAPGEVDIGTVKFKGGWAATLGPGPFVTLTREGTTGQTLSLELQLNEARDVLSLPKGQDWDELKKVQESRGPAKPVVRHSTDLQSAMEAAVRGQERINAALKLLREEGHDMDPLMLNKRAVLEEDARASSESAESGEAGETSSEEASEA